MLESEKQAFIREALENCQQTFIAVYEKDAIDIGLPLDCPIHTVKDIDGLDYPAGNYYLYTPSQIKKLIKS